MIRMTGLWINKNDEGKTHMAGNVGGVRYLVFKNERKRDGKNDPDYYLCVAENKKREDRDSGSSGSDGGDVPF